MAAAKMFDTRWIRRYRPFLIVSILILASQIFIAYYFFVSNTSQLKKVENSIRNGDIILHHRVVLPVDDEDDDDSPSNSLDRQTNKINSNNQLIGVSRPPKTIQVPERHVNNPEDQSHPLSLNHQNETNLKSQRNASVLNLDELDFVPQCEITSKEAVAAIVKARTQTCKEQLANVTCLAKKGVLYPKRLPRFCPIVKGRKVGEYLGCFRDQQSARLLTGHLSKLTLNSPNKCLDLCLQSGFQFAGVQYSHECFCGDDMPPSKSKVSDTLCDSKCPEDANLTCGGFYYMNIYLTGLQKLQRPEIHLKPDPDVIPVRILYVLTLNGRAVRQVRRLLKNLYHIRNYYYIHVDVRQDYLYRQLLVLEEEFANIRLSRRRMSTIWGGASLLLMLLQCMEDTLKMTHWKWDFFINLSESDFPIKTSEDLVQFLTANREKNFVKSHGKDTQRFIGKQGLDKTFYECDTHMWRVGDRKLPWGVRIDGGSDWVALSRSFCGYLVTSKDDLVVGLKTVYKHTLLPAESFFHTVLRNSEFCNTYVNNNLRLTNWKRKIGCRCQYEHIVDWCGCSPNDFKPEDWTKIQSTKDHLYFFARKFEPVINQKIIDQVETWLYGPQEHDLLGLNKHWQNDYNHLDTSPKPNDVFLTVYHSITRLSARLLKSEDEKCQISPAKVLEATTYNDDDNYKGILILFESTIGREKKTVTFETLASPLHHFTFYKPIGPTSRLKYLQVGTNYDQKEQLFRNFALVLGPLSELYILHKWGPGNAFYATFAWIDPTNTVVTTYEAKILAGIQVDFHKPPLQRPLRPGVWTVKLLYTWQVVAETKFLISPVSFMNGVEIGHEHVRFVHNGPNQATKNENFTSVERLLGLSGNKWTLTRQANSNAQRYGKDLIDWIDNLTSQFYVVQETCYSSNQLTHLFATCANIKLEICETSKWSSRSPDPKSEIGGIDEKTGRLMR